MFVDKMFKLRYKNEQNITLSVSFTYNSPICSLKIKVSLIYIFQFITFSHPSHSPRVSVQGVESLWGDCRLGVIVADLFYFAFFEDFSP